MAAMESTFIYIIISLSILLFTAKLFAELFQRLKYTSIIIMVATTTIITPIWMKKIYQKELSSTT
jgi:Kef-type K+ transport system membrane component KefB